MSTHSERSAGDTYASEGRSSYDASSLGAGWVGFAAIMLVFVGVFNIIDGIVALGRSSFYVANAHFVFSDLKTWGWIILIVGIVQVLSGATLGTGSELARWLGIIVASLSALGQLMFVQAYPFWSIAAFAINILIIYALTVYAGRRLVD
jgi:hypothetical protein